MPTSVDGNGFSNISAATAAFPLRGGQYGVFVNATFGGGSVSLQRLSLDGSTWVAVASATTFTAAGAALLGLPRGSYRFNVATATAVYAEIQGIPS